MSAYNHNHIEDRTLVLKTKIYSKSLEIFRNHFRDNIKNLYRDFFKNVKKFDKKIERKLTILGHLLVISTLDIYVLYFCISVYRQNKIISFKFQPHKRALVIYIHCNITVHAVFFSNFNNNRYYYLRNTFSIHFSFVLYYILSS